ncbi:unnamed protein product [Rhodiola kirilowii]
MSQQLSPQIMTPETLVSRAALESTQEVFPDVRVIVNVRSCSKKSQMMLVKMEGEAFNGRMCVEESLLKSGNSNRVKLVDQMMSSTMGT